MLISGSSNFKQLYNFSIVLSFIKLQSLQAQVESRAGAGIKILSGLALIIWCKIPDSVATINFFDVSVCVNFNKLDVLPICSETTSTGLSHSGCAIILASGFSDFIFKIASKSNCL